MASADELRALVLERLQSIDKFKTLFNSGNPSSASALISDFSQSFWHPSDPSQFINPEAEAQKYMDMYGIGTWSSGDRIMYDRVLAMYQNIRDIQAFNYEQEYNNASSQDARMDAAGLNADLLGLQDALASSPNFTDGSLGSNVPTGEQLFLSSADGVLKIAGTINSLISSASSMTKLPVEKALLSGQNVSQSLANVSSTERMFSDLVSRRFSDSIGPDGAFDYDTFLADRSNYDDIYSSFTPADNAYYRRLFDSVVSNRDSIVSGALQYKQSRSSNQLSVSEVLASPFFSDDMKLSVALMRPIQDSILELDMLDREYQSTLKSFEIAKTKGIDIDLAIKAYNTSLTSDAAEDSYNADYYGGLSAEDMSKYDAYLKRRDVIIAKTDVVTRSNLNEILTNYPNSPLAAQVAFLRLGGDSDQISFLNFLRRMTTYNSAMNGSNLGALAAPQAEAIQNADEWLENFSETGSFVD